jgi:anhydro-N-acetylmuramic acid kinase
MIRRWYIGLSSGSSLLGVDAALVRAEGLGTDVTLHFERFHHYPYSPEMRDLLIRVTASPTPEMRSLATLHRILGETYAVAARQLLEQSRRPVQDIMAIGCPGQSLWHDPEGRYPSTFNLGMMGVLAERTGLTTLSDFSSRDLALGGQGVPITALVDALLFHHPHEHRVSLHLGSVATAVSLPAHLGQNCRNVIAFQAAPCTMLLDGLMRLLTKGRETFDAGGKHAVQGRCLEPLLERWLRHPFFQRRPPKCVPRSEFGLDFLNGAVEQAQQLQGNLHDVLCTMTHFVAEAIVHSLQNDLPAMPTRFLLSGGGVRNGFLWHLLEQKLHPLSLEKTDAHGVPTEACQAVASAGLAALAMDGVPINLPSVTGATGARLLGQFTPGSSSNWARCLAWMARQTAPMQSAAA